MYNKNALDLLSLTYGWIKQTSNENIFAFKIDLSDSNVGLVDCFGTTIVPQIVGNQPIVISDTTPIKVSILNDKTSLNEIYVSRECKHTKQLKWKLDAISEHATIRFTRHCVIRNNYTLGYELANKKYETCSRDHYLNIIEDETSKVFYGVYYLDIKEDGKVKREIDIYDLYGKLLKMNVTDNVYMHETYGINIESLYERGIASIYKADGIPRKQRRRA